MRTHWRDGDRTRVVELNGPNGGRYAVTVDGVPLDVEVERLGSDRLRLVTSDGARIAEITAAGTCRFVRIGALDFVLEREAGVSRRGAGGSHAGALEAPMPGLVTRVLVKPGDVVTKGQPLLALEAMKMEHLIRAPKDGTIVAVAARAGEMVNGGVALIEMD